MLGDKRDVQLKAVVAAGAFSCKCIPGVVFWGDALMYQLSLLFCLRQIQVVIQLGELGLGYGALSATNFYNSINVIAEKVKLLNYQAVFRAVLK